MTITGSYKCWVKYCGKNILKIYNLNNYNVSSVSFICSFISIGWRNDKVNNFMRHLQQWRAWSITCAHDQHGCGLSLYLKTRDTYNIHMHNNKPLQMTWAGHVSRIRDSWWILCVTTWKPYNGKQSIENLVRWLRDKLHEYCTIWQRIAQDRQI